MEDKSKNLEKKAWYRILKVFYGMGWIIVGIITIGAFLILKPTGYIDLYKSTVTCSDGNKYRLNSLKGFYTVGQNLTKEDQLIAHNICSGLNYKREEAKAAGYSDQEIADYLSKKDINYSLNLEDQGSWGNAFLWTAVVLTVCIFLLNLIRNIVLYITIGKKFSYWWLVSNKDQEK